MGFLLTCISKLFNVGIEAYEQIVQREYMRAIDS